MGSVFIYKVCSECKEEKPVSQFYRHKSHGYKPTNKCKECIKAQVARYRASNLEKVRAYDRERNRTRERILRSTEYSRQWRKNNPEKYEAHLKLNNALRSGKINKGKCAICGIDKNIEAHHEDYSQPLEVLWLCSEHHSLIHFHREEALKLLGIRCEFDFNDHRTFNVAI